MTIAYDGTAFHGWQKQDLPREQYARFKSERADGGPRVMEERSDLPEMIVGARDPDRVRLRTVQEVVERAVREVVREPVNVLGASRTDTEVHALAQCAAFTTSEEREGGAPDERLVRAINSRLADDVVVRSCERVRHDFDPIKDCDSKGYRYSILDGGVRPLFERARVARVPVELDVEKMREAAGLIVGEHDFAAFASAGHGRESTVRTVLGCDVRRREANEVSMGDRGVIEIDVSGTGFLYNMVRIIAGTLVEVGKGKMTTDQVGDALARGERGLAGPTMAAEGLCLMWIKYPDDE